DGSVGSPHVRVGHCQTFIQSEKPSVTGWLFCVYPTSLGKRYTLPYFYGHCCGLYFLYLSYLS
ncbi:hypothetical protein, partial [Xenorhabdus cabanillasii]|uniref:hypothetical protein n=1 Tax=Xenorhabdus cabanillasii TaxID=351673 RepID=UPI001E346290